MLKIKEYIFAREEIAYIRENETSIAVFLKGSDCGIKIQNATLKDVKTFNCEEVSNE